MSTEKELQSRSESKCELCGATENLTIYEIPPESNGNPEQSVLICKTCKEQIDDPVKWMLTTGAALMTVCGARFLLCK